MLIKQVIKKLQQTNSSNEKIMILERYDCSRLREMLLAAYHPYQKYGLSKLPWDGNSIATIEDNWTILSIHLAQMADAHGDDTIKAKTAKCISELTREDAEIFKNIIKKDLKCGITATTINKAMPGLIPVFGIMKAATFEDKLWQPDLMGSVKLDGYRCLVRDGKLYSSGGHLIQGARHIQSAIHGFGDFDAEIMVPEMEFNKGGGAIRSANVTPDAKLFVFDCINNPDMPFAARYAQLTTLGQEQGWSASLAKPSTITVVRHRTFASIEEMRSIYDKALYAGYEGLVLKNPDSAYELKRSKAWLKVKQVLDEDCRIVGFFEGEGKYRGQLGGVIVQRANGYTSKVGGGFSDAQRLSMWYHQNEFIGKTVEVHYQNDTPDGDFRQARFKRFRRDKDV